MNSNAVINHVIGSIYELLSTDGTTMDPAVACIITDALIKLDDYVAFLTDQETSAEYPIVTSDIANIANATIQEIYQVLSKGGSSQDSAVAYMIKEELAKVELHLDILLNQQAFVEDVGSLGLSRTASVCPELLNTNICRETSHEYRRDDYGWNYTPEWAQAMSDSTHTERIKHARDQIYHQKCEEAGVCYDFNCFQCLLFTCSGKNHTKFEFDEEEIDEKVRTFINTKSSYPEFKDYVDRYGYEYLGKGPSGIAKRLADIQDIWNASTTEYLGSTVYNG